MLQVITTALQKLSPRGQMVMASRAAMAVADRRAYDAIVLGGGVVGCATAFALARRGAKVALLERESQLACGATARSSACIRTHYSVLPTALLANRAVEYFENFRDELGDAEAESGFVRTGLLLVGADDETGHTMARTVGKLSAEGIDTRLLTSAEARELCPPLELGDAAVFGWEPRSGYADPHLTTTSFARAARGLGTDLVLGCAATGLETRGGRVAGVRTEAHGTFESPLVVSCLNVWSGRVLGGWLGETLPVRPEKHSLVSVASGVQQRRADGSLLPIVKDLIQPSQPYFRPCAGGAELLIGDNLAAHVEGVSDADAWDESVSLDRAAHIASLAAERYPAYSEARVTASWSGLYDVSPDFNPVLGGWPSLPGLSVAFGFSGHGFKLAPLVGEMLADDALGLEPREDREGGWSIGLYAPERFAEERSLRGSYGASRVI